MWASRRSCPASQADPRPVHNLDALVGQDIPVKIIKLNRRRGNVVVSRKMAVEEEIKSRKGATLEHLAEGAVVTGVVKNLTEYGAFIDLGGIDGLLHVTDMSYGRVTHPSEMLHVGDEITVKVLKFDRAKERVSLGMKQLGPDPWEAVSERYPVNARVIGRVVNVTDYGAFVELEAGVEGLIHISEMTWSRRMKHPSKVVKPGDQVEAVVLEVHPKDRRISLGLKQLEPNPWTTIDSRYSVGSVVEGRVRNMTDFGAFIEIEEGIDGLVHVSDLSWTKRVKHPSEVLKKGQIVQAVILNIDSASHRLSLGIKQLQPDAWESYFQTHQVGDTVHGRVCRLASFGGFRGTGRRRGRAVPFLRGAGLFGPARLRRAAAGRGPGVRFQDHQDERGGEENRPQPARRGGRRGEEPAWKTTSGRRPPPPQPSKK